MLMVPWSTFFHALQSKLDKDYSKDEEAIKNFLGRNIFQLGAFQVPQN